MTWDDHMRVMPSPGHSLTLAEWDALPANVEVVIESAFPRAL